MGLRVGTGLAGVLALLTAGGAIPATAAAPAKRRPAAVTADDTAVKQGAEAWEAGNYARALAIWRPLAAAGNADAQYNLAQAYRLGRGVTVDETQARDWYLKAAKQDHPEAQANYGLLLFQGSDRVAALPWLEKAATHGDARAQYVLGTALFNGDIYGKDWVRAYALMTRASAAGLPQASTSLAAMDRYMPVGQRQQGTALARDMERSELLTAAVPPDRLVKARAAKDRIDTAGASPAAPAPGIVTAAATSRAAAAAGDMPSRVRKPVAPATAGRATPAGTNATPRPVTPVAIVATNAAPAMPPRADVIAPPAAVARAPHARPAPPAAAPMTAAAGGGWRVEVGAFADPDAATAAWSTISTRVPGLALRSYLVKAGAVTRLQAGPLATRADAARMCARIVATGGAACFPVVAP